MADLILSTSPSSNHLNPVLASAFPLASATSSASITTNTTTTEEHVDEITSASHLAGSTRNGTIETIPTIETTAPATAPELTSMLPEKMITMMEQEIAPVVPVMQEPPQEQDQHEHQRDQQGQQNQQEFEQQTRQEQQIQELDGLPQLIQLQDQATNVTTTQPVKKVPIKPGQKAIKYKFTIPQEFNFHSITRSRSRQHQQQQQQKQIQHSHQYVRQKQLTKTRPRPLHQPYDKKLVAPTVKGYKANVKERSQFQNKENMVHTENQEATQDHDHIQDDNCDDNDDYDYNHVHTHNKDSDIGYPEQPTDRHPHKLIVPCAPKLSQRSRESKILSSKQIQLQEIENYRARVKQIQPADPKKSTKIATTPTRTIFTTKADASTKVIPSRPLKPTIPIAPKFSEKTIRFKTQDIQLSSLELKLQEIERKRQGKKQQQQHTTNSTNYVRNGRMDINPNPDANTAGAAASRLTIPIAPVFSTDLRSDHRKPVVKSSLELELERIEQEKQELKRLKERSQPSHLSTDLDSKEQHQQHTTTSTKYVRSGRMDTNPNPDANTAGTEDPRLTIPIAPVFSTDLRSDHRKPVVKSSLELELERIEQEKQELKRLKERSQTSHLSTDLGSEEHENERNPTGSSTRTTSQAQRPLKLTVPCAPKLSGPKDNYPKVKSSLEIEMEEIERQKKELKELQSSVRLNRAKPNDSQYPVSNGNANPASQISKAPAPTKPRAPVFATGARIRPASSSSTPTESSSSLSSMAKRTNQGSPTNLNGTGPEKKSRVVRRNTVPKAPQLSVLQRSFKKSPKKDHSGSGIAIKPFKARPLPNFRTIHEQENEKRKRESIATATTCGAYKITVQEPFNLSRNNRRQASLPPMSSSSSTLHVFKARPVPVFSHAALPASRYSQVADDTARKPKTVPIPFHLESKVRHELAVEDMHRQQQVAKQLEQQKKAFTAKPLPDMSRRWEPKPTEKEPTLPLNIQVHTDRRALERKRWEDQQRAKEEQEKIETERMMEELNMRKEEEIRALRQSLTFKARPMPAFYSEAELRN